MNAIAYVPAAEKDSPPSVVNEYHELTGPVVGGSPLKKVTKCSQRLETIADDLRNGQHGHREDHARNTPHPEPEDERDNDEDRIEGEPPGQKHRRYGLALNQVKSKIKSCRNQRLPERVMGQQTREK